MRKFRKGKRRFANKSTKMTIMLDESKGHNLSWAMDFLPKTINKDITINIVDFTIPKNWLKMESK